MNSYGYYLENNLLDSGEKSGQNFMIEENPVYQNYIGGVDGMMGQEFVPIKPFSNEKLRGVDASQNSEEVYGNLVEDEHFLKARGVPQKRSRKNFGGGSKGLHPIVNKDDEFDRMGKKLGTYGHWTKDRVRAMLPDKDPSLTFKVANGNNPAVSSNNGRNSPS